MDVPLIILIVAVVAYVPGILWGQARYRDLLKRHSNLVRQHRQLTQRHAELEEMRQQLEEKRQEELGEEIPRWFMIEPCFRCHEFKMQLLEVSPSARSIHYRCRHCEKKMRAPAGSPTASKISEVFSELKGLVSKHNELRSRFIQDKDRFVQDKDRFIQDKKQYDTSMFGPDFDANLESELIELGQIPTIHLVFFESSIFFESPAAPLPYEQTSRTPIPEAARSEVWRRDNGRCVQCGSKEHLQFDHIIPIVLGGATTVANLQLLCQPCNGSKGKKI